MQQKAGRQSTKMILKGEETYPGEESHALLSCMKIVWFGSKLCPENELKTLKVKRQNHNVLFALIFLFKTNF